MHAHGACRQITFYLHCSIIPPSRGKDMGVCVGGGGVQNQTLSHRFEILKMSSFLEICNAILGM